MGELEQAIGLACHGRDNYHQLVPGGTGGGDLGRNLLDAIDRANRRSAVFLYQ
jgi:hypothetical protein